jgi:hypothetical protein
MYTTPTIVDRGDVTGRTLGSSTGATIEQAANFLAANTNDALDHDTINGFPVDKIVNGVAMTLDNPNTGAYKTETLNETE